MNHLTFGDIIANAAEPCPSCGKTFFDLGPPCDRCWVDDAMTDAAIESAYRADTGGGEDASPC